MEHVSYVLRDILRNYLQEVGDGCLRGILVLLFSLDGYDHLGKECLPVGLVSPDFEPFLAGRSEGGVVELRQRHCDDRLGLRRLWDGCS